MKTFALLTILILSVIIANAQPCKLVKPGMNKAQVQELVGEPTEISVLGKDGDIELAVWHYGNQRISFRNELVDEVVADGKGYDELAMMLYNKQITTEEYQTRLNELNRVACE